MTSRNSSCWVADAERNVRYKRCGKKEERVMEEAVLAEVAVLSAGSLARLSMVSALRH